jgi:hypothetical protein
VLFKCKTGVEGGETHVFSHCRGYFSFIDNCLKRDEIFRLYEYKILIKRVKNFGGVFSVGVLGWIFIIGFRAEIFNYIFTSTFCTKQIQIFLLFFEV